MQQFRKASLLLQIKAQEFDGIMVLMPAAQEQQELQSEQGYPIQTLLLQVKVQYPQVMQPDWREPMQEEDIQIGIYQVKMS